MSQFTDTDSVTDQQTTTYDQCRREPRYPANDPATLQWVSRPDSDKLDCRILDVSKSGMQLAVPDFIMPGAIVRIQARNFSDLIVVGQVRYCVDAPEIGFHIGIQILEVQA